MRLVIAGLLGDFELEGDLADFPIGGGSMEQQPPADEDGSSNGGNTATLAQPPPEVAPQAAPLPPHDVPQLPPPAGESEQLVLAPHAAQGPFNREQGDRVVKAIPARSKRARGGEGSRPTRRHRAAAGARTPAAHSEQSFAELVAGACEGGHVPHFFKAEHIPVTPEELAKRRAQADDPAPVRVYAVPELVPPPPISAVRVPVLVPVPVPVLVEDVEVEDVEVIPAPLPEPEPVPEADDGDWLDIFDDDLAGFLTDLLWADVDDMTP